jgi:tetratricopeptide (TPR) repeat protein
MAKKINNTIQRPVTVTKQKQEVFVETPFIPDPKIPAWLYNFKIQAIIVGIIAFVLYFNTFNHEYALDDTIVIVKNEYVYEGFAGIPSILTKDAFDSYYKQFNSSNQLSGGRYRPLSIATFAFEQQFLGAIPIKKVDSVISHAGEMGAQEKKLMKDMHVRHVFNVLWYTLSVIVLLYFLRYVVFRSNPLLAFLATLVFAIHPLHTEVVANVKSRDEIMSLLFICLTFIFAFKYEENKDKKGFLVAGMISFFLAFLSKEYAVGLMVLMPLSFFLFKRYSFSKSLGACLPYLGVMAVYIFIRLQVVGPKSADAETDILNNPYALANEAQQLATKIATTLNYLKLLIFPHPLSADYSYNTIPYKDFTDIIVWISLAVHLALIRGFFYFLKRKNVLAFAIAFYLVNILLICNIIFNIGGTMGERLCYHSSVGFAIAVAYLLYMGAEKLKPAAKGRFALAGCMVLLIALCGFKTIDRNRYWKNDQTLFFEDIKVSPNSVLVNADVASSYVNMSDGEKNDADRISDLHKGITYFTRAIEINPSFVSGFLNRGMAYFKLKQPDSAYYNVRKVWELYPRYPKVAEMMYNIGVNFYVDKRYQEAIQSWNTALQMDPNYVQARNALGILNAQMRAGK